MEPETTLLPMEQLEHQMSSVDLLLSMFSLPGEIEQSDANEQSTAQLRNYIVDSPSTTTTVPKLPPSLDFSLNVPVDTKHILQLHVQIPLSRPTTSRTTQQQQQQQQDADDAEPPPPSITFRCPTWMNRKAHLEIAQRMPTGRPDCILEAADFLKEECASYLSTSTLASQNAPHSPAETEDLVRVWFYLQSLSTRSKRDDMVNWAPGYGLTGFVLAGKPGILCLEGAARNVDAYMSDIKTRSWSDVPSHQKKVSERYREEGRGVRRVFRDMREVTGEISKGGHRGNRGEMGEVKALFEEVGLGEVFAEVIGL